jgi:hypothetical protein
MFRKRPVPDNTPRCSFCRRAQDAVGQLIPSPCNDSISPPSNYFIYICSECVAVCNSLLDDRRSDKESHGAEGGAAMGGLTVPDDNAPPVIRPRNRVVTVRHTVSLAEFLGFRPRS